MSLDVVVLAAGKGSRMKSDLPKVLHTVAGKPMLEHVLDAANLLNANITVVVGHGAVRVEQQLKGRDIHFAEQLEQLGTGHAVRQALGCLGESEKTLILYGDVPLIRAETLQALLSADAEVSVLTAKFDNPTGYGRIIRKNGGITGIVEQKDASSAQLAITEINTGIMAVNTRLLHELMPKIDNNNAQNEYYLTDLIAIAANSGVNISGLVVQDNDEINGANNRKQLADLEAIYRHRKVQQVLNDGATLVDPNRIDIQGELTVGKDVVIEPNVIFKGNVTLSDNVTIEANSIIIDSCVGNDSVIYSHSRIENSDIGENAKIGPFARIRPGTELANNTKVGNFVETKKAYIGEGSKVNHLSYVGDANIGTNVNIGAGTITCNYDGKNKHQTTIEDDAFIGSNTALVAPVNIGKNVLVGAGSTITQSVPDSTLAVARQKQRHIKKP